MRGFFRFIASPAGRVIRVVAGLVLIAAGVWWITGVGRWIAIIIGLVPLAAGLFDWCVFAPLFSLPFVGDRLRRQVRHEESQGETPS